MVEISFLWPEQMNVYDTINGNILCAYLTHFCWLSHMYFVSTCTTQDHSTYVGKFLPDHNSLVYRLGPIDVH